MKWQYFSLLLFWAVVYVNGSDVEKKVIAGMPNWVGRFQFDESDDQMTVEEDRERFQRWLACTGFPENVQQNLLKQKPVFEFKQDGNNNTFTFTITDTESASQYSEKIKLTDEVSESIVIQYFGAENQQVKWVTNEDLHMILHEFEPTKFNHRRLRITYYCEDILCGVNYHCKKIVSGDEANAFRIYMRL